MIKIGDMVRSVRANLKLILCILQCQVEKSKIACLQRSLIIFPSGAAISVYNSTFKAKSGSYDITRANQAITTHTRSLTLPSGWREEADPTWSQGCISLSPSMVEAVIITTKWLLVIIFHLSCISVKTALARALFIKWRGSRPSPPVLHF